MNAAPTPASQTTLSKKELSRRCLKAINNLRTLKANYTQTLLLPAHVTTQPSLGKEDRTFAQQRPHQKKQSTGTLWLQRPPADGPVYGQVRFEETQPGTLRVIGTGRTLYVWQGRAACEDKNAKPEPLPLSATPLGLLLRHQIKIGRFVIEKSIALQNNHVLWTLTTPEADKDNMSLTLVFSYPSFALQGWHLNDQHGGTVVVALQNIQCNVPLKRTIFQHPAID